MLDGASLPVFRRRVDQRDIRLPGERVRRANAFSSGHTPSYRVSLHLAGPAGGFTPPAVGRL